MQHEAAEKKIDFFKIIRHYRIVCETHLKDDVTKTSRHTVNAVILQKQTQKQSALTESESDESSKKDEYNDEKCLCEDVHAFQNCLYIMSSKRESD